MLISVHREPVHYTWDAFVPTRWSQRVHQLLPRSDRLRIREMWLIYRLRPEVPLSRVGANVFAIIATLVAGSPQLYVCPIQLYPFHDEPRMDLEEGRAVYASSALLEQLK